MAEYRIDDLARAGGTTVRNARVYQDRGLLPPPRRDGRVGWYSEAHLIRLRLIGRLLDRGYTFSTIGELLEAWEGGRDLREVLGLEEELTRSWSDEVPGRTTLTELRKMFGTANPRMISRAESLGLVKRTGATSFSVPSPRMLQAGTELVAIGVPMEEVLDIAESLSRDMDIVADRFVRLALRALLPESEKLDYPDDVRARQIADNVRRLRPQASSAVNAAFASAMGRRVGEEVDEANRRMRSTLATETKRATADRRAGSGAPRSSAAGAAPDESADGEPETSPDSGRASSRSRRTRKH